MTVNFKLSHMGDERIMMTIHDKGVWCRNERPSEISCSRVQHLSNSMFIQNYSKFRKWFKHTKLW